MNARVAVSGRDRRLEMFNANYGLTRGIAASALTLSVATVFVKGAAAWKIALLLAVAGAVALYRMHRFGVHYARELFVQLLEFERSTPIAQ